VPGSLSTIAWIACVLYSTIPAFWLLIHPRAEYWRTRRTSPYKILLPVWIAMWVIMAAISAPWRGLQLYRYSWTWLPAIALFASGLLLYKLAGHNFSLAQLGGLPEVLHGREPQTLSVTGIRGHIRHPVYLGHLCEMIAWSLGSGLAVCWALTAFAIITGAIMIRMEDKELELRFGEPYRQYRASVPALFPNVIRRR
jgi:protein-S-isoprenylcysteine O-methyltransferase Ste14